MPDLMTVEELLELGKLLGGAQPDPSAIILKAQELLRVRDREGQELPLKANKAQQHFEKSRKKQNIILKARQMGMTTWVAGRFFLKTVSARGVLTVQVAQTKEAAEAMFRIVQRFWNCLPREYKEGALRKSRSNVRQMIFPELDSEFRILSAADGSAGRGMSIQNLHCSEVSRWPGDARETLAGLRAALSPSGELVLESTPNGAYGCFYNEWRQAPETGMAQHFLPWWYEDAYRADPATDYTEEERALAERHGLTAEQIGYRRRLDKDYRDLRAQEFAEDEERCFRATGECRFDTTAIEKRLDELGEPVKTEHRGALLTWWPRESGREYLLAVDPAGGSADGDYSVVQVIDMKVGMQCAELQQRLRLDELADRVVELALRYNGALVAVERNNHGGSVLTYLKMRSYERVYFQGGEPGFLTTTASKPQAIARLCHLLVEHSDLFYSKRLLTECRSFVSRPNGSAGAAAGAYDDCVMAMAIGQHVRAELLERAHYPSLAGK